MTLPPPPPPREDPGVWGGEGGKQSPPLRGGLDPNIHQGTPVPKTSKPSVWGRGGERWRLVRVTPLYPWGELGVRVGCPWGDPHIWAEPPPYLRGNPGVWLKATPPLSMGVTQASRWGAPPYLQRGGTGRPRHLGPTNPSSLGGTPASGCRAPPLSTEEPRRPGGATPPHPQMNAGIPAGCTPLSAEGPRHPGRPPPPLRCS